MCFSSYQMEHQDMYETPKLEDGFNDQDFCNYCRGYINNKLGCSYSGDFDRMEKRVNTRLKDGNQVHKDILSQIGVQSVKEFEQQKT